MAKVYLWYYGAGSTPDMYYGGFATRDQAVEAGREWAAGETFSIVEAQKGDFAMISGDDLMEHMLDRLADDDMCGEDYPELSGSLVDQKAATDELTALLSAWFDRHRAMMPKPWAFADQRNEETFHSESEAEE